MDIRVAIVQLGSWSCFAWTGRELRSWNPSFARGEIVINALLRIIFEQSRVEVSRSTKYRSSRAAESQSRYLVHNYENGALLRIEPVRPIRDNTVYECLAENGVGDAVLAEAQLRVYEGKWRIQSLLEIIGNPDQRSLNGFVDRLRYTSTCHRVSPAPASAAEKFCFGVVSLVHIGDIVARLLTLPRRQTA